MFGNIALIGIVVAALVGLLCLAALGRGVSQAGGVSGNRWGRLLRFLICFVLVATVVILGGTGFYAAIGTGHAMSGWLLMLHATMAPVFCIALAAWVLIRAQTARFVSADIAGDGRWGAVRKGCFWLMVALGVPVILSIVLSMVPLFGTVGQRFLYHTHQYTTLAFLMLAMVYVGLGRCAFSRGSEQG